MTLGSENTHPRDLALGLSHRIDYDAPIMASRSVAVELWDSVLC
jgi:hypothetical protein